MPTIADARQTYASTLAFLTSRTELPVMLNERGLHGCGVEIGVKQGEYSEFLLSCWRGRHLISVDPWLEEEADKYVDIANVEQSQHERYLAETRQRLGRFGARSSIWRMTSLEANERIPRHSLDFVYIDARHDYASVLEDLEAWYDKVRPGGIIAGHDYLDGMLPAGEFGVKRAVDEFFGERGLIVYPTLADGPFLTWMAEICEAPMADALPAA